MTRKTAPISFEERIRKINEIQRGWLNYFRGTSIVGKLLAIDGWAKKSTSLLYLDGQEENRTEKEKPDTTRS